MMIKKVLNHNAAIVEDGEEEKVVIGSGLAFQKKKNDVVDPDTIEKMFVLKEDHERVVGMLSEKSMQDVTFVQDMIRKVEEAIGETFHEQAYIALFSHFVQTIERLENGATIHNPLLHEIKLLFPDEFESAKKTAVWMEKKLGVHVPEDETGYLALHMQSVKDEMASLQETVQTTRIIQTMIEMAEKATQTTFPKESLSYQALLNHLQLTINTYWQKEPVEEPPENMVALMKEGYPEAFNAAEKAIEHVKKTYDIQFPAAETMYIAMHIQRLLDGSKERGHRCTSHDE